MAPNLVIIVAFLLGAAVGAILVSLLHGANIARVREEFQRELQARVEADMFSRGESPGHPQPSTSRRMPSDHAA